jgi:hypothetical protein
MRPVPLVSPFGLSLGAALIACERTPPSANPPPPVPAPAPAPATPTDGRWNGLDALGRTIFKSPDGGCYVILPFTPDPTRSIQPPPTERATCPPHMDDSWLPCAFGTLTPGDAPGSCVCAVMGNPPAPPKIVACPTPPAPQAGSPQE